MISVFDALNSIDQAGRSLRGDEDRLNDIIRQAATETARLRAEQAELFRSLARIRLDTLRQENVVAPLDDAEKRALAALREQDEKLKALSNRRDALQKELAAAQAVREDKVRIVTAAADAIASQKEATEHRMAGDLGWQKQAAVVSGAEAQATAAEDKARQSEADRDEKSKPYLADPLFVYLWERGYGTSAYKAGPITRMGDGYVARVVQYEPARQNYFTLTEIPKRLREHANRLKATLADEEAKLVALERAALEADGIVQKEKTYQDAEAALKEAERVIGDLEKEGAALDEERNGALGTEGPWGMGRVLGDLAASMQREDLRTLLRESLDTPTTEDEQIVRRLQALEDALEKQEKAADEARRATVELARKRAELERSRDEARRYERQGGGFSNDKLIGDILGGIIGGALSSRELRDALRSGYRQGGSRSSLPSRPGGGTFGGDIFGGGGGGKSSSSGDGFRTGGSF